MSDAWRGSWGGSWASHWQTRERQIPRDTVAFGRVIDNRRMPVFPGSVEAVIFASQAPQQCFAVATLGYLAAIDGVQAPQQAAADGAMRAYVDVITRGSGNAVEAFASMRMTGKAASRQGAASSNAEARQQIAVKVETGGETEVPSYDGPSIDWEMETIQSAFGSH